jgi:hypothetical protein
MGVTRREALAAGGLATLGASPLLAGGGNNLARQVTVGTDTVEYYKDITIDKSNVDSKLTNWPLAVKISDADVATRATDSGDDIYFETTNGKTLSHEKEHYNSGTLVAFVKLPQLKKNSDTVVRMFYGDDSVSNTESPVAVWTNGYRAVWHLKQEEAGTGNASVYPDSTGGGYDGDDNVSATGNDGVLWRGQEFDGSDDYIDAGNVGSTESGEWAVSTWAKTSQSGSRPTLYGESTPPDWPENLFILSYGDTGAGSSGVRVWYRDASGAGGNIMSYAATLADGEWHHVAVVQEATDLRRLYVDGVERDTHTTDLNVLDVNSAYMGFNEGGTSGQYFDGYIDEVRASVEPRTADWVSTSFENQNDPASFYTVGPEVAA